MWENFYKKAYTRGHKYLLLSINQSTNIFYSGLSSKNYC